ncbi:MAG: HEPN domain-containing protein [Thermoprotei archaeon]
MLDDEEFKRWVESASRTLESARVDHAHGFYSWACFKAHQAAEKAIKALLWGLGRPRAGHSLPVLLSDLRDVVGEVSEDIVESCMRLNKYYIPTRYPDVWSEGIPEEQYTEKESLEAISMAEEVVGWVRKVWESLKKE